MEKQILFRDFQEQVAADHNNLQQFARQSLDHLTHDAVTKSNRYSGSAVVQTAQAEVNVAPGRFYDQVGAIFERSVTTTQSMVPYLAAAAQRIIAVSVYGTESETDVEERDHLVSVETGQTKPEAMPMVRSRNAVLVFTTGAESADPQPPPVPVSHAVIAYIKVDTLGVLSIEMQTQNAVVSTENLDGRTRSLEAFREAIEPRVTAIASDVASLANDVATRGDNYSLEMIYRDLARLKSWVAIPDLASDYGADHFLTHEHSDVDDTLSLGFNAYVEEGIRFAKDAEGVQEIKIFSANDPNASVSSGLLLPRYTHELKLAIGPYHSDIGIAQYGFQTHDVVQRTISRKRIRYGTPYTVCTNSNWWRDGSYNITAGIFRKDGETFEVLGNDPTRHGTKWLRIRQVFEDWYEEPYWDHVIINHSIQGALVSQSFLVGNDMWATQLGFYMTVKAANENVFLTLCEVTNGVPDLSKAILHQNIPHANLGNNKWVTTTVVPTFLKAGKRYAVVLVSNANHRVGMASGQSYLDGTFFYSTDGVYHQGDLTKDMMIRVWGAKFNAPQVTIEMEALSLSGGIQAIDVLAGAVEPYSTELIYEIQPGGTGEWRPLTADDLNGLAGTPPLCRFRVRFVGTRDMMPGIQLTGSEVRFWRPKTQFTHITPEQTIANASDDITVQLLLEDFDETPHDVNCRIRVGGAWVTPDMVETELVTLEDKRYSRVYNFQLGTPTDKFIIEITGSTNSAANTYHVAERIFWAIPA